MFYTYIYGIKPKTSVTVQIKRNSRKLPNSTNLNLFQNFYTANKKIEFLTKRKLFTYIHTYIHKNL